MVGLVLKWVFLDGFCCSRTVEDEKFTRSRRFGFRALTRGGRGGEGRIFFLDGGGEGKSKLGVRT